jgi:hypothetical protein
MAKKDLYRKVRQANRLEEDAAWKCKHHEVDVVVRSGDFLREFALATKPDPLKATLVSQHKRILRRIAARG